MESLKEDGGQFNKYISNSNYYIGSSFLILTTTSNFVNLLHIPLLE